MNAIFGIFYRNACPVPPLTLEKMQAAMSEWDVCNCDLRVDANIGLGQSCGRKKSARLDGSRSQTILSANIIFMSSGHLYNASELCRLLNISESERMLLSDHDLMQKAYCTFGERCSELMIGDWSFAAWHPMEQRLFLSRDHLGTTSLYYYIDDNIFAFATLRQALLALKLASAELDELYVAQYLISWTTYHGERTYDKKIFHLPPSHYISVTQNSYKIHQYWHLDETPELLLPRRSDYVDALREKFEEAVACRIPVAGRVAVTLSGGLDSSSVAAIAARILKENNHKLTALTSIPLYETKPYLNKTRFGNEFPYAQSVAKFVGNIDLHALSSAHISPIWIIRKLVEQKFEPVHGSSNLFWYFDLLQLTKAQGCDVLLTGALGNGGVSWKGDLLSQPLSFLWSHLSINNLANLVLGRIKQKIKLALPVKLLAARKRYHMEKTGWLRETAINPQFAKRINLLEQRIHAPDISHRSPKEQRCGIVKPGRYNGGAFDAQCGALNGLEIRDPTADVRLLSLALSVPDHIFIEPQTGIDRWLIREAMKGYIPEDVRLNRKRGIQSGDLVPRLRDCSSEVEGALFELSQGPASEYIDADYMYQVWRMIRAENTIEAHQKAVTVLTRGIMAGLFVNHFNE